MVIFNSIFHEFTHKDIFSSSLRSGGFRHVAFGKKSRKHRGRQNTLSNLNIVSNLLYVFT